MGDRCTLLARGRGPQLSTALCSPSPSLAAVVTLKTQAPVSDASRSLPSPLIVLFWDGRDKGSP